MTIFHQRDLEYVPVVKVGFRVGFNVSDAPLTKVSKIKRMVVKHFGLRVGELESQRRQRRLVTPRHIAFWLAHLTTNYSYPRIAREFDRDHTTIILGVRNVEAKREANPEYRKMTDGLLRELGG